MKPGPAPCPHCGAPARRFPYQHDANRFYFGCSTGDCAATYTNETQAVEAWNRRSDATVDFLQARLIERTEQSTLTAYRDAETIRQLREALREARTVGLYPGS